MDDYKSPNNLFFVVAIGDMHQAFIVPPLSGEGHASAAEPFEGGTGTVSLLDIWTGFSSYRYGFSNCDSNLASEKMVPAEAVAIAVVVPGGFGGFFQRCFRGCDHILAGAQQGEAAVDILLISNGDTIEWLRTADDAPPVVAVMAVVAWSESASSEHDLAAEVEGSKSWDTALRLFRQWREPGFGAEDAPPSFRVTALRDKALAQPRMNDVARAVAGGIHRRWGWPVSMTNYALEVCALWLGRGVALAGLPLTPGWHACERTSKGCFFPAECRSTQTADGGAYDHSQPRLRPSACHGLLLAALLQRSIQRSELLVDPMCGVGSIPAEALRRFGASFVLGGDSCAHAVKDAARCVRASGLDTVHWDVRQLPLRSGVADRLVVDMPWGNRGKGTLDQATLHAALVEIGRVLTEGGTAVLLLLRAAAARISRLDCRPLLLLDVILVNVGGWPVAIARLRKASAAHAAAQEDTEAASVGDGRGNATPDASSQQLPLPGTALPGTALLGTALPSSSQQLPPAPSLPPPPEQPLALPQPLVPPLCSASSSVSRCCGAVRVSEGLEAYPLGELLVAALPSLVRSISNARHASAHHGAPLPHVLGALHLECASHRESSACVCRIAPWPSAALAEQGGHRRGAHRATAHGQVPTTRDAARLLCQGAAHGAVGNVRVARRPQAIEQRRRASRKSLPRKLYHWLAV